MNVRSFWQATRVENAQPPYNIIQYKVCYAASTANCQQPYPIVIFFSGFNCNLAMYEWLALSLVPRGLVVVLFNWLAENIPGQIAFTPGVNFAAFTPDTYGTVPSASALPLLLVELERLNTSGELAGLLDLQKIILGGHSAGGRIALDNANTEFFPQIVGAFSYGSHTAATKQLGYEAGKILSLPNSVPMLLIGGTHDGVIAQNSHIYGLDEWGTPATPIIRTFREAIVREHGDCYLLLLAGANHFSIADPLDSTLEVTGLDFPAVGSPAKIRLIMAEIIGLFISLQVCQKLPVSEQLDLLVTDNNSLVALFESK